MSHKKRSKAGKAIVTSSLVLGAMGLLGTQGVSADGLTGYTALGNGADVRADVLSAKESTHLIAACSKGRCSSRQAMTNGNGMSKQTKKPGQASCSSKKPAQGSCSAKGSPAGSATGSPAGSPAGSPGASMSAPGSPSASAATPAPMNGKKATSKNAEAQCGKGKCGS